MRDDANADLLSCHVSLPVATNLRKCSFNKPFHLQNSHIALQRRRKVFKTSGAIA